jgi:dolichol-phosphate mannosyltransferase
MKLSIIVPVYNEIATLEDLLERIKRVALNVDREIIVVDDGSTDGTRELVKRLAAEEAITACFHERNIGKGGAIRTGIEAVTGDMVIIQDGDLEYDPSDYEKLVQPIVKGTAQAVYGSRILGKNPKSYLRFYWGGRILSFLANLIYGIRITDEPTCYKVFQTGLLKSMDLACTGFEFCPEVTAKLSRMGVRIMELPISYFPRSIKEGKKIRWTDGLIAIWTLWKYRNWTPGTDGSDRAAHSP